MQQGEAKSDMPTQNFFHMIQTEKKQMIKMNHAGSLLTKALIEIGFLLSGREVEQSWRFNVKAWWNLSVSLTQNFSILSNVSYIRVYHNRTPQKNALSDYYKYLFLLEAR